MPAGNPGGGTGTSGSSGGSRGRRFSFVRPENSDWTGFPTKHPMVSGAEAGPVSNVRLSTFEEDGRHYVIPTMVDGVQIQEKFGPLMMARRLGLEKYPWFNTAKEAVDWSKSEHALIDEQGQWRRTLPRAEAARHYGAFMPSPRNPITGENKPVPFSFTNAGLRGLPHNMTGQEWGQQADILNLRNPYRGTNPHYPLANIDAHKAELLAILLADPEIQQPPRARQQQQKSRVSTGESNARR